MSRRPEQVRAAMARAAAQTTFDAAGTWRDVLFTDDGDLSRPGDPDRALLTALTEQYPELDRHADTLPGRLHREWLEDVLRIPRLPVVPDHVVAHATVDPRLAPAVLPAGTLLRGGKDATGAERRYRTTDALTAHGATVTAVRSLVPGGGAGLPGEVAEAAGARSFPLDPHAGADAPHTLRLHSPVLAFEGGTMTVRVAFDGAASAAALVGAGWTYPRVDGTVAVASGVVSGNGVTLVLAAGCGLPDGGTPWLEAAGRPGDALSSAFAFTRATVQVTARSAFVPQAAYVNDGLLDVSKEFQPFGPAAKRGDALYLRSDEAFGKPLETVTVAIEILQEDGGPLTSSAGGSGVPDHIIAMIHQEVEYVASGYTAGGGGGAGGGTGKKVSQQYLDAVDRIDKVMWTSSGPRVEWQRRVDGEWQTFKAVGPRLTGMTGAAIPGPVGSEPAVVGGRPGHLVRAFLAEGDFGWTEYQRLVAAFATEAVKGSKTGVMPVPPVPPIVSRVTLRYTTPPVACTRVEAINGWARTRRTSSAEFRPFRREVSPEGDTGMVAIGLDLPASVTGSSVSVFLGVESAAPCGSTLVPDAARWQWWDGAAWRLLAVSDGSQLLRESGLLRFVAPRGWAVGCSATGAETGRWIRLVTRAPDRLGVLTSVTPDAVVAAFVSAAPDPELDPSPAVALPAGTIKGTVAPVTGVKKVTNLIGVRGRGPESDDAYRRRASAMVRHRGRAVTAWDYEEIVTVGFPEVAAVRCLPHTASDGSRRPGSVGLVLVPDRPHDPAPRPSVSLSGRVADLLAPLTGLHATPAVLCALYEPVTVEARVVLRRGIAALSGQTAIRSALEAWLHPTGTVPTRWGRSLYRSSLEAFLDGLPMVDAVEQLVLRDRAGAATELVDVDLCRGLYCSAGTHLLDVEEQL